MGQCVTGIWSSGASEFLSGEKEQLTLTEKGEHSLSEEHRLYNQTGFVSLAILSYLRDVLQVT